MTALNYLNYVIASVEPGNVTVDRAVGRCRLLFHLKFDRMKWDNGCVPFVTSLRVHVRLNGALVGIAFPVEEDFLGPESQRALNPVPVHRSFGLDIAPRTLDRIEQERMGQGITLELEVVGTATIHALRNEDPPGGMPGSFPPPLGVEPSLFEPRSSKANVHCQIAQSEWIDLLDRMGYTRTLLFEIPWPTGDGGKLREAISHFESARKSFLSGDYKGAVAELRDSLDSACSEIGCDRLEWGKVANLESRKSMELHERFLFVWNSVRHLTHSAHHGGNYSREEARYILGMGALALSLAATAPGVLQQAGN